MGGLVDIASAILSAAGQRLEVSAQNIANAATPGYRRAVSFSDVIGQDTAAAGPGYWVDFSHGKEVGTGNPYDLAISSDGFFTVRSPDGLLYTRAGQFQRDGQGHLVTPEGYVLQADNGGDLELSGHTFQVQADGTVVEDGQPTATIALAKLGAGQPARSVGGGYFQVADAAVGTEDAPSLRQGAYETSNVSSGDEMIRILQSLRQAEAGQRLVGVYDDLMGRVLGAAGGGQ